MLARRYADSANAYWTGIFSSHPASLEAICPSSKWILFGMISMSLCLGGYVE